MKRLPPAIREKNRYLKFKIEAEKEIELGEIVDAVWSSSLDYLGTKDSSRANFWVIGNQFDRENQEGIIRVNREMEDDFRAALTLVEEFGDQKGFIRVKKVSGSIKKLQDS